jgi:hypothetical protein
VTLTLITLVPDTSKGILRVLGRRGEVGGGLGGGLHQVASNESSRSFDAVFLLSFRDRLPLNVAGSVDTSSFEWDDVTNHVAGAGASRPSGRGARL